MNAANLSVQQWPALDSHKRNRFFYGKLLDAYHFKLETDYVNAKRWLLNRLVGGYGVLCGLDVQLDRTRELRAMSGVALTVMSGVAIDPWGREIIVPEPRCIEIPEDYWEDQETGACEEDQYATIYLCYRECDSDPAPVLIGDCSSGPCTPGSIKERYEIKVERGKAERITPECRLQHVVSGRHIDYCELVKYVSRDCDEPKSNPCLPLATIRLGNDTDECQCNDSDIDICVRPIVYTNDLLFDLLICLCSETTRPKGGK
jgi:hypothetical protein